MTTRYTPIQPPEIDTRNERQLVEYAMARVYQDSGGLLNDFSASSPTRALIEGQCFAMAELLYYANRFGLRVADHFLQIAGIQQRLGAYATVTLTFTLTQSLFTPFTIPKGYLVLSAPDRIGFTTDSQLVIPAGFTTGTVAATCNEIGTRGNVTANSLTILTQPLSFLQSVTNATAATGGLDEESLDDTRARGFEALRRRGLLSEDDYANEVEAQLGVGSVAKVIPNLAQDGVSYFQGAVHVFALNQDGTTLNDAQASALRTALAEKSPVFTKDIVFVSSVDVNPIDVLVFARLVDGTNPSAIATAINTQLTNYLTPGQLPLGESIYVNSLIVRVQEAGVSRVEAVQIADEGGIPVSGNCPLPYSYSVARLVNLTVHLSDGRNVFIFNFQ